MANKKIEISDEVLEQFCKSYPAIYIGYYCDPKMSIPQGWLEGDGVLPSDTYRVQIRQVFPVFSPSAHKKVEHVFSEHNLYVGKEIFIDDVLEHKEILKDEWAEKLEDFKTQGIDYGIVVKYGESYEEAAPVTVVPYGDNVYYVSDVEKLRDAVKTITDLHSTLVRLPVCEGVITYRKK